MAQASDVPNAAQFLARALPWPVEGGPKFFVNIHYRRPLIKNGKPVMTKAGGTAMIYPGRACTTVQEAAQVVAWANTFDTVGTDIYVCMSAQSLANAKTNQRGNVYYTAVRDGQNAVLHKSFYVDVDVKPNDLAKGYASTHEAASEFGRIRKAIGLPVPTMVVRSGSGGFHAHWVLSEAIPTTSWEPLAHALVAALGAFGFRGDLGCTIDRVRLLRVPDTKNHKQAALGIFNPVTMAAVSGNEYLLDAIAKPLEPYKGMVVRKFTAPINQLGPAPAAFARSKVSPADLSAGITSTSATPVPIGDLVKACPWIANTLATGGKANNNALWLASTNIALFTPEGRDAAHWMAQGHPDYQPAATEDLWERQKDTRLQRNMGWPRCQSIAGQGAQQCKTCPHLSQGKSPFNFVAPPAPAAVALVQAVTNDLASPIDPAAAAALIELPRGYSYGKHGTILLTVQDPETGVQSKELLCEFPMLKPWMQDHPATFNFTTYTAGRIGVDGFERQIRLPLELVHDKSQLAKTLAQQHVVIPGHNIPRFCSFMVSWIESLRANRDNVVQSAPFGWYRHNGKLAGFIYAKNVWSSGIPRPASNPDPVLERQYQPTGELEPWTIAAKMITDQGRPQLEAMLASAFAAPLVALVGQTGLLMSTYSSESGIGKSTTMKIAQAVWGHPKKAVQSLSDTMNSVIKKMGDIKNLPMYWDELKTQVDTTRFVQLAFQLAQGKEKSRMAADTSFREPGTWETMLVSTSNDSLMSHITAATKTTSAGIARIFEFAVPPGVKGQISGATAQQITAEMDTNYGCAGLAYSKFLGANATRVHVEVDEKLHEIERQYKVTSEERFWLAMVTVIIMGARYANELGLTEFNEPALELFMLDTFKEMRRERENAPVDLNNPMSMLGHLTRFINMKRPHNTVVTNYIHSGVGRPPAPGLPGSVTMRHDTNSRLDEVQVQFGTDTQTCRFLKAPFCEWLDEQALSRKLVIEHLTNNFNVKEIRGRLASGTPKVTMSELCLEFYYGDPVFKGFIEI